MSTQSMKREFDPFKGQIEVYNISGCGLPDFDYDHPGHCAPILARSGCPDVFPVVLIVRAGSRAIQTRKNTGPL